MSLVVSGFEGSPGEISALLGITPTRTWLRGDPIPPSIVTRKDNAWVLDAGCPETDTLSRQIEAVLKKASHAAPAFANLPPGVSVQLFCAISDYERAVVLEFPRQVICELAALGAQISIDYYDLSEAED